LDNSQRGPVGLLGLPPAALRNFSPRASNDLARSGRVLPREASAAGRHGVPSGSHAGAAAVGNTTSSILAVEVLIKPEGWCRGIHGQGSSHEVAGLIVKTPEPGRPGS